MHDRYFCFLILCVAARSCIKRVGISVDAGVLILAFVVHASIHMFIVQLGVHHVGCSQNYAPLLVLDYLRAAAAAADPAKGRLQHRGKLRRPPGVVFLLFLTRTKRRKMAFFEGCPVGWGGYPPELAWWRGG